MKNEKTTTEWCSFCENEVEIPNYINSRCPVCNEIIFPCSCCDEDNCYNCKYE